MSCLNCATDHCYDHYCRCQTYYLSPNTNQSHTSCNLFSIYSNCFCHCSLAWLSHSRNSPFHTVLKSNLIPSDKCRDSYRNGWFFDYFESNFSQPAVIPLFIHVPCSVSCWNSSLHSNYSIAAYTMPSPDPMFSDKCMLQAYQNIPK